MKMYRTTTGTEITEHEIIKATRNFVYYFIPSGDGIKEGRRSKEWNWHETRGDAVRFLIKSKIAKSRELSSEALRLTVEAKELEKEL